MTSASPAPCPPHPSQERPGASQNWLARAASAVLAAAREMYDAQQRLQRARMSYSAYLPNPGQAPDTYAQFLLRTSVPPRHEPTAAQRAAGRKVR